MSSANVSQESPTPQYANNPENSDSEDEEYYENPVELIRDFANNPLMQRYHKNKLIVSSKNRNTDLVHVELRRRSRLS